MIVFMVFVTGAAVSLAIFHLGRGLTGFTPEFDRRTVERIGRGAAFALYCGAGPVLLVRALQDAHAGTTFSKLRNITALTFLISVWTGALGVVAVESMRPLL